MKVVVIEEDEHRAHECSAALGRALVMRGNTLAVVVANRHDEELSALTDIERVYHAKQAYAAGIMEAIEHYDFYIGCRNIRELGWQHFTIKGLSEVLAMPVGWFADRVLTTPCS